jgi:GTP-binding protein Era
MVDSVNKPCLLCVNKIDKLNDKRQLLPILARQNHRLPFDAVIPISATKKYNLAKLKAEVRDRLPWTSGYLYPAEQISDRDTRSIVAELIREQLIRALQEELPYSVYVEIESYEQLGDRMSIAAIIWVARDSHKAIVIGRSGAMLKKIGSHARMSIQQFLDKQCYLGLWVRVKPNWQDNLRVIAGLT